MDDDEESRPTTPPPARYDLVVDSTHGDEVPTRPPPRRTSGTRARSVRVLVAERDSTLRSSLLLALTEAGYDAIGVADGRRALELIASGPPDVIVANIALPHLAGDSLLGWARTRLGTALLSGILISSTLRSELLEDAVADAVVGAPLAPAAVVRALDAALEARGNGTER